MKRHLSMLFAVLIMCTVFTTLMLPANAAEIANVSRVDEGYVTASDNDDPLPFTLTATKVYDRLFSKASTQVKEFTPEQLDCSTIVMYGHIKSTNSNGLIRASVCYYNGTTHVPDSVMCCEDYGEVYPYTPQVVSALIPGATYWSCIRNVSYDGVNYVSGNITVDECNNIN